MANQQSSHASFVKSILEKIGCSENNDCENNVPVTELESPFFRANIGTKMEEVIPLMVVPDVLRKQNENAYSPTIISIGPLHIGTPCLQPMEAVKLRYTRALLRRTRAFKETMEACAASILRVEQEALKIYYESARLDAKTLENVRLAEVMLIDGCFIIELLYRNFVNVNNISVSRGDDDHYFFDSILSNPFKCYEVQRDLLLLENQIPFNVLTELFKLTVTMVPNRSNQHYCLSEWVFIFFGNIMGLEKYVYMKEKEKFPRHMLHLLHSHFVPSSSTDQTKPHHFIYEEGIKYSATELCLAGVELKAAGKKINLFHVNFTTAFSCCSCSSLFIKGHLEIPPFTISDSTELFLRNLIAFELNSPEIPSYFTSFAFLMDLLINTPEDVKLLEESKIIRNNLGSGEEVARLFNGICKNATSSGFHYSEQYKEAMDFCKPWRVSSERLRHYYFGNPWSGISVIAAIILFVLTFLSTLYSMLSYY